VFEEVDHDLVRPVEVVDPEDERTLLAPALENARDAAVDRVAQRRHLRTVERRRISEEVAEDLDELHDLGMIGREVEQAARLASGAGADVLDRTRRVEAEVGAERARDREPDVALSVRRARPLEDADRRVEVRQHLVDQSRLADAALAEHVEKQPAALTQREVHRRVSKGQLTLSADEAQVHPAVARTRRCQRTARDPRRDRLVAAAGLDHVRLVVVDHAGRERVRDLADEHGAGGSGGLDP
jgi:hypothetical protein